jgi:hypothetical protein
MKLLARQIRFFIPSFTFTRVRPQFVGNRNTLQLLETALVIEGYRMRFHFVFLDRFFRQPLSEWTTVTVPYSRILRFRHSSRLLLRVLVTGVVWFPVGLLLALGLLAPQTDWAEVGYYLTLLGLLAVVLTVICHFWLLAPCNYLWYRQADGRKAILAFWITSRKLQRAFEQQLEGYRRAARDRGAVPGSKDKESRS